MSDNWSILHNIPGVTQWVYQRDGWWMEAPGLDVLKMAQRMKDWGAYFSTMTGSMLPNHETAVIYHYIFDECAYNIKVHTQGNHLVSISNILPAADWIEREIQDLYQVEFEGHPHPIRLIRPNQLEAGLFREEGGTVKKISEGRA